MAANDGFDVVVVLAGDGTLNEAADGLLHTDTALAPLPGGSTNVYARTLGFDTGAIDAANELLRSLARGATKRIGVGRARTGGRSCSTRASASTPPSSGGSNATAS